MTEETKLILEELHGIRTDIDEVKIRLGNVESDISGLKSDVSELKTRLGNVESDVSGLKSDVNELKTEVNELKSDVNELKTRLGNVESDVNELKSDVKEVQLTLENETNHQIRMIAEGHLDLSRKLNDATRVDEQKELLMIRVSVLEGEVRRLKAKIE